MKPTNKPKTETISSVDQGIRQIRHIRAKLSESARDAASMADRLFMIPFAYAPYLVPVSRRVE